MIAQIPTKLLFYLFIMEAVSSVYRKIYNLNIFTITLVSLRKQKEEKEKEQNLLTQIPAKLFCFPKETVSCSETQLI